MPGVEIGTGTGTGTDIGVRLPDAVPSASSGRVGEGCGCGITSIGLRTRSTSTASGAAVKEVWGESPRSNLASENSGACAGSSSIVLYVAATLADASVRQSVGLVSTPTMSAAMVAVAAIPQWCFTTRPRNLGG
jgi:hypothetical protein